MIIDSKLSKSEYVRINIAMIFRRTSTYILIAFTAIMLLFCLYLTFLFETSLFFIIWSSFIVFAIIVYWYSIYRVANSKENSKMYLPIRYEFTENVVNLVSPISKEETKWDIFVKWCVLAGHYLLFVNSTNFLAIRIADVLDKEEFEKMLREKVKKP